MQSPSNRIPNLILLVIAISLSPSIQANEMPMEAAITKILSQAFPPGQPGAAVAIAKQGQVIYRKAFGSANLELDVPMEPDMVFRLGSITKQFTAAAILLLAEEGRLSLTDDIRKHVPNYPTHDPPITIEHLLTHTPGIVSYTGIPNYFKEKVKRDLTTDELVDVFKDLPAEFPAGTQWKYNNSGYVLLGAIIEQVSQKSYATFIQERIFDPLGMQHSHYGGHQIIPRRVSGYDWQHDHFDNARYLSMTQPHAAGSLLSTVDDLTKWYQALSNNQILREESFEMMARPYRLANGEKTSYGNGFFIGKLKQHPMISHGGGIPGFSTHALYLPSLELSVSILTNRAGTQTRLGPMANRIAAIVIDSPSSLIEAIKQGRTDTFDALLRDRDQINHSDERGNTALHWAALHSDLDLVKKLLDQNAEVDALNQSQATPLIYAAGNLPIVRLLVDRGANVNQVSKFKSTPLTTAARHPTSHPVIEYLLERGADLNVKDGGGSNALEIAAEAGDLHSVKFLLSKGLEATKITRTAMYGRTDILPLLLESGADVNQNAGFAGHALNFALYGQHSELAVDLIQRGADLNLRSSAGQHETPPILWAAYNEHNDQSVAAALIERGVDVNALSALGDSALDWALARNNRALAESLRQAGARQGTVIPKQKPSPNNIIPDDNDALDQMIRNATARSIELLQTSSDGFLLSPTVARQKCVSCHQQTLPSFAFSMALQRGIPVDKNSIARQVQDQVRYWSKSEKIPKSFEMIRPQPDWPVLLGYGLLTLDALKHPADELTDAMIWFLLSSQQSDGSWPAADYRPPIEDGPIQGAVMALRSLQAYPLAGLQQATKQAIQRAHQYLEQATPKNSNQQVFQLLGLHWAGNKEKLPSVADKILQQQRPDGGWAPLTGLPSDAWATGQALVALKESAQLQITDPAFRAGIHFLLRTQFEDGSWYVKSRSWPFQPHFETGFPHGKDQWISAGATAWATMALLLTQPMTSEPPPTDWMSIEVKRPKSAAGKIPIKEMAQPKLNFARDIQPLLTRSCGNCHGAEAKRKKGRFSIESRDDFLKGGQSELPLVDAANLEHSHLLQLVTDQIEDLEMPPLSKRHTYPALNPAEVSVLKRWLEEGLPW